MDCLQTFRIVVAKFNDGGGRSPRTPRTPMRDPPEAAGAEERQQIIDDIASLCNLIISAGVFCGLIGATACSLISILLTFVFPDELLLIKLVWLAAVLFFLVFLWPFFVMIKRMRKIWIEVTGRRLNPEEIRLREGFSVPEDADPPAPAGPARAGPAAAGPPAPFEGAQVVH